MKKILLILLIFISSKSLKSQENGFYYYYIGYNIKTDYGQLSGSCVLANLKPLEKLKSDIKYLLSLKNIDSDTTKIVITSICHLTKREYKIIYPNDSLKYRW